MFGKQKPADDSAQQFTFEPSEALQQFMAEVHEPSLDFTDPNDIGKAAEALLQKLSAEPAPAPEVAITQLKADFCGILNALQESDRSPLEKQTIITNAVKRFQQ